MTLYLGNNLISGVAYPTEPTRNLGQIIESIVPLTDAGLHLLDGTLINGSGIYSAFVDKMADLYDDNTSTFIQPKLTSNGTLGGSSFAVSASSEYSSSYQAYMAFDNSNSTEWANLGTSTPLYIEFYNPMPLNVTLLTLTNRAYVDPFLGGTVYGSNDGTTWTSITTYTNNITAALGVWTIDLSSNTDYYTYYKIEATSVGGENPGFSNIAITATQKGLKIFCSELEWQSSVTTYGVCGKFVYDSVANTVRLPKITGILEGTTDATALGDLVEAGLPNITGTIASWWGNFQPQACTGAFVGGSAKVNAAGNGSNSGADNIYFDASGSNSIYGNSNTVQPQTIKCYYYIVIATTTKTEIEVDIDQVTTDLNGKADVDLSNLSNGLANTICTTKPSTISSTSSAKPAVIIENYVNGTSWYRVWSDGWCEQGGLIASGTDTPSFEVTLLKAYVDTNYDVWFTSLGNNSVTASVTWQYNKIYPSTTSKFICARITIARKWQACGYII